MKIEIELSELAKIMNEDGIMGSIDVRALVVKKLKEVISK